MRNFPVRSFGVLIVVAMAGCVSDMPYASGPDAPFANTDRAPVKAAPEGNARDARWDNVLDVGGADLVAYDNTVPTTMLEVSVRPTGPARHVVAQGETLYAIALRHLGDGNRWRDLIDANPGLSAEALAVGQVIRVP